MISPTAGCSPAVLPSSCSVNQRLPPGPGVSPAIVLKLPGTANDVKVPVGVILPMVVCPVIQRFPSGPVVIVGTMPLPGGLKLGVAYSETTPAVVIRPTSLGTPVNQRAPSGPAVISSRVTGVPAVPGDDPAGGGIAGTANSVTTPAVVIRPTSPGTPVNQSAPSGPTVTEVSVASVPAVPGDDPAGGGISGTANSVTTPVVVIRPTSPGTPVNHRPPSGPAAIAVGIASVLAVPGDDPAGGGTAGRANSVTTPAEVIRPISPGIPVNQSAAVGTRRDRGGMGRASCRPRGRSGRRLNRGQGKLGEHPRRGHAPDLATGVLREPEISVRALRDPVRLDDLDQRDREVGDAQGQHGARLEPRRFPGPHPGQFISLGPAGIGPARSPFIITLAEDGHMTSLSNFFGNLFRVYRSVVRQPACGGLRPRRRGLD